MPEMKGRVAVAWFRQADWPQWCELDPDFQPDYGHWLRRMDALFARKPVDVELVKVVILPAEFQAWAKAAVRHGEFGTWLTEHVSFAERTAQAYMRIASNWPAIEAAKTATVADLTVRGALAAVRASTVPAKRSRAVARPMRGKKAKRMLEELDQIQVLACLLDAWDEASDDTRVKFFQTLLGRGEFMAVVQSARKAA